MRKWRSPRAGRVGAAQRKFATDARAKWERGDTGITQNVQDGGTVSGRIAMAANDMNRLRVDLRRIAELALEIAGAAAAIDGPLLPVDGSGSRYSDQMTIRVRRRMFALPVADIVWIEGASQYSRVHARGGEYMLSRSLASLEYELDPSRFFRIHRSAIVNAAYVREVMSRGDGRYNVYLHGGQALPLGRGRRETLHRLLGKKSGGPKAAAKLPHDTPDRVL
jgi:DNA-binding LytR/AlgR family response regulator